MKRIFSFMAILALCANSAKAQQSWAIAVMDNEDESPVVMEYHGVAEKAENGTEYLRIVDDSYLFRKEAYNPVKLQYGYRWDDRQLFVYDFENNKETLAFDFNLKPDDSFTTFNGMEWKVVSVKDTLVNMSFCGQGKCVSKKLLDVKTLDGKVEDKWLEDFGSFMNHFMIRSLENVKCSQALWMEYEYGEYLAREISADPLFAHDSGWMDGHYGEEENDAYAKCMFRDGTVVFENVQWWWEHREYSLFWRDGDDIRMVYGWEMTPHVDGGVSALRRDVATFKGLPNPESGRYIIHVGEGEYATGISDASASVQHEGPACDIQGRRVWPQPASGVLIWNRKKVLMK